MNPRGSNGPEEVQLITGRSDWARGEFKRRVPYGHEEVHMGTRRSKGTLGRSNELKEFK